MWRSEIRQSATSEGRGSRADAMALDEADAVFVKRRSALVRRWPIAGSSMLVGIVAVFGFLVYSSPLLVNPWQVAARIKAETLAVPTLTLMAALLPIVFLSCFVLLRPRAMGEILAAAGTIRRLPPWAIPVLRSKFLWYAVGVALFFAAYLLQRRRQMRLRLNDE